MKSSKGRSEHELSLGTPFGTSSNRCLTHWAPQKYGPNGSVRWPRHSLDTGEGGGTGIGLAPHHSCIWSAGPSVCGRTIAAVSSGKTQTRADTWKHQPAHLPGLDGTPSPSGGKTLTAIVLLGLLMCRSLPLATFLCLAFWGTRVVCAPPPPPTARPVVSTHPRGHARPLTHDPGDAFGWRGNECGCGIGGTVDDFPSLGEGVCTPGPQVAEAIPQNLWNVIRSEGPNGRKTQEMRGTRQHWLGSSFFAGVAYFGRAAPSMRPSRQSGTCCQT